jgi:hypothetical protein
MTVRHKLCWISLAFAGLARETGFVVIFAFTLAALRERNVRRAVTWALAVVPGALWNAFVVLFIPGSPSGALRLAPPILSIFGAMGHLQRYLSGAAESSVLHALDVLAIIGLLLSMGLGFRGTKTTTLAFSAFALSLFGVAVSSVSSAGVVQYNDVYNFARQGSPLLLVQLFQFMESRNPNLLWPLALMLPRSLVLDSSMTWKSVMHLVEWRKIGAVLGS